MAHTGCLNMQSKRKDRAHIDVETFSRENLKTAGAYRYAEDTSTDLLSLAFTLMNDPVSLWVPELWLPDEIMDEMQSYFADRGGKFFVGLSPPKSLLSILNNDDIDIGAHNAMFERRIFRGNACKLWAAKGFDVPIRRWVCTAAKANALALPDDLKSLAKVLPIKHKKDENGRGAMMQVSKPRKPSKDIPEDRWTPHNSPDRFITLYKYNVDDVYAERACDDYMPDLPPRERRVWCLDQTINDRGIKVDTEAVRNAQIVLDKVKKKLEDECVEISGVRPTQTAKVAEWIADQGVYLQNLQSATMRDALKTPQLKSPDFKHVRKVIQIRALHSMKATAKFKAIEAAICGSTGRLHGMFRYHQASTGRWSSVIVQLQNLFRSVIKDPDNAISLLKHLDNEMLEMMYAEHPMKVLASCVRGMLIAGEGKDLLCADYNSIEGRMCAWMARQEDKLEIFNTHGNVYEYTGAKMYGLPHDDAEFLRTMKKTHPDERFAGKTGELLCQFQGSYRALLKSAEKFGIDMSQDRAEEIVSAWRSANPQIVKMWYAMEKHAIEAVLYPGRIFKTNTVMFKVVGDFLYMRLPSKRKLAYYMPRVDHNGKLTYLGVDTYTRRWCRVSTYGGRLTENAVQGASRDVMVTGMFNLEDEGYPLVGTVHDEAITEVDTEFGDLAHACSVMCIKDEWMGDLPVSAGGFRELRYKKDLD